MILLNDAMDLVDLVYPALTHWVNRVSLSNYVLPPRAWFAKHDIYFVRDIHLPGRERTTGTYYQGRMRIEIAVSYPAYTNAATFVHELTHAIQFFNLGARFTPLYSEATVTNGYTDNPFEVEAREASDVFIAHYIRSTKLRDDIDCFAWRAKVVTPIHTEREWYYPTRPIQRDWEYKGFWKTYRSRRGLGECGCMCSTHVALNNKGGDSHVL
jgi:hypothetical protein